MPTTILVTRKLNFICNVFGSLIRNSLANGRGHLQTHNITNEAQPAVIEVNKFVWGKKKLIIIDKTCTNVKEFTTHD